MSQDRRAAQAEARAARARAKSLRPWYRKKRFWLLGVVIVVVIIVVASTSGGSPKAKPAQVATNPSGGATKHTSTPKAPVTLLSQSGSGDDSTASFTAPSTWQIEWTYDCSNFGEQGNFAVDVAQAPNGGVAASVEDPPINQLGNSDSGTEHYYYGGTVHLEVTSECDWTIKAVS
jgi:hypothetical protein